MAGTGLVSVTFRKKTPAEICALCRKTGLTNIEWGGDVHVPPDGSAAKNVACLTREAGLAVCSYGSYWHIGQPMDDFRRCLDTACELQAPAMRIWAGSKGSKDTLPGERAALTDVLCACSQECGARGVRLALEYHGMTLTDSRESVRNLLRETESVKDSLFFYWQPRWDWSESERLSSLEEIGERLLHIHAFTWDCSQSAVKRLPLQSGGNMWKQILPARAGSGNVLLEFVADDDESAFQSDAQTLRRWMEEGGNVL